MNYLDLNFALGADGPLPADHGYLLYSALSRVLPELHRESEMGVHPISGKSAGPRKLELLPHSRLRFRVPDGRVSEVLEVTGKTLQVGETMLAVGPPSIERLSPLPALRSRLVTIKIKDAPTANEISPELFTQAVRRQLEGLNVSEQVQITIGKRRTLRIRRRVVVGYELVLEGLTAEESLVIQESGLGGRRHMGCGIFVPLKPRSLS
ncbi:CRISPR/Cas system-associated RAMP protein Cas6 [Planctomycetales bacterium 10988]|nr:CRISPR/Cas system-associated RAMP protein Cas6 [Planctomycetales bacterium 10988]